MKTKIIQIYDFNELSESAKETALNEARQRNYGDCWWEFILDDAKDVGVLIKSFDLDRNRHAKGYFIDGAECCAHFIVDNHGETCETYKTATAYLKDRDKIIESAPIDADGEFESEYNLDCELNDLDAEFLRSILEDYSRMLQRESEYRDSKEYLLEMINCNEYTFNVNGKLEAA